MPKRPYFTITPDSFEKNAGYKSTVHALAELIDNAFEAEAKHVCVVLQIDRNKRLETIAVGDNGLGMLPGLLQGAVCEKAGEYLSRQRTSGPASRRKLGKYGVGLPKASISQCNKFTVWSWQDGVQAAYRNGIDITDHEWIADGAEVEESIQEPAPAAWIKAADLEAAEHGTLVVWEDLDGITWSRARWGEHSGLIPNLEFDVGRVYRKLIAGEEAEFSVQVVVLDHRMKEKERLSLAPNDPLYITPELNIPREALPDGSTWPSDDPLFDDISGSLPNPHLTVAVPLRDGTEAEVKVSWRASSARKNTFARLNGRNAGSLPHGKHAKRNVGLSILREGREILLSTALANPSEPRERWFGLELDLPHELDAVLGMTNNKQEYTRLERVLPHPQEDYTDENETTRECLDRIEREDPTLAVCLRIAWATAENWSFVKQTHFNMREEVVRRGDSEESKGDDEDTPPPVPEEQAEAAASDADRTETGDRADTVDPGALRGEMETALREGGVPQPEAQQMAARIVDRGLTYAIATRAGLGSPFFSVSNIRGVKFIQLNEDHPALPYIRSSIADLTDESLETLRERLEDARVAMLLILEAWGKLEVEARAPEERRMQQMREDWGRVLERFVRQLQADRSSRGRSTS